MPIQPRHVTVVDAQIESPGSTRLWQVVRARSVPTSKVRFAPVPDPT